MKNIEIARIGGLKCDCCDYVDDTIPYKDYKKWVNRPCPICGANLLTKMDYRAARSLMWTVRLVNLIPSFLFKNKERVRVRAHFDGSGCPSFELTEIDYSGKDENA